MKSTMILKQGIPVWLLAMVLLAGCAPAPMPTPPSAPTPTPPSAPTPAPAEVPPAKEQGETERVIEVEAEGLTCHYLRQSFWAEEEFSAHLANQAQFEADFKQDFEQGLTRSDVPVSASDYSFSFDSTTQSTLIRCDVHGAISKRDNSYSATFFWLLRPLGLDFIDDNF